MNQIRFPSQQRDRFCVGKAGFQKHEALARAHRARGLFGRRTLVAGSESRARRGVIIEKIPQSRGGVDVLLLEQSAQGLLTLIA